MFFFCGKLRGRGRPARDTWRHPAAAVVLRLLIHPQDQFAQSLRRHRFTAGGLGRFVFVCWLRQGDGAQSPKQGNDTADEGDRSEGLVHGRIRWLRSLCREETG